LRGSYGEPGREGTVEAGGACGNVVVAPFERQNVKAD
jgi:hypothetical protein